MQNNIWSLSKYLSFFILNHLRFYLCRQTCINFAKINMAIKFCSFKNANFLCATVQRSFKQTLSS